LSTPEQWFSRISFRKRTRNGIDPATRLPRFDTVTVLDDAPCDLDLSNTMRVAQQGPNGTVYTKVNAPACRIFPPGGVTSTPDEDDDVTVDGRKYRVTEVSHTHDPGSGAYLGTRLVLQAPEIP
jgi:hypothetical protein